MTFVRNETNFDQNEYVFSRLHKRWNCVINGSKQDVTKIYRQKTILTLAIQLHKYGFTDKEPTIKAITAIDYLNRTVVLTDDFCRKSAEIKDFLQAAPVLLKRKPSLPHNVTFYRPKDVISIQLDKIFYAAYIHQLIGPSESPIIEFYDKLFDKLPTLNELDMVRAKGRFYSESKIDMAWFGVDGLKNLPDPANQIQLISTCVEIKPDNKRLQKSVGLYQLSNLFTLQREIVNLFESEVD